MGTTRELLSGWEAGFASLCFIIPKLVDNLHICNTNYSRFYQKEIIQQRISNSHFKPNYNNIPIWSFYKKLSIRDERSYTWKNYNSHFKPNSQQHPSGGGVLPMFPQQSKKSIRDSSWTGWNKITNQVIHFDHWNIEAKPLMILKIFRQEP